MSEEIPIDTQTLERIQQQIIMSLGQGSTPSSVFQALKQSYKDIHVETILECLAQCEVDTSGLIEKPEV